MMMKLALALALTAMLTPLSGRLMAWFLQRNKDSLAEYNLEPGPVCSHITLAVGIFVALTLGLVIAPTTVSKALSCFLLYWLLRL